MKLFFRVSLICTDVPLIGVSPAKKQKKKKALCLIPLSWHGSPCSKTNGKRMSSSHYCEYKAPEAHPPGPGNDHWAIDPIDVLLNIYSAYILRKKEIVRRYDQWMGWDMLSPSQSVHPSPLGYGPLMWMSCQPQGRKEGSSVLSQKGYGLGLTLIIDNIVDRYTRYKYLATIHGMRCVSCRSTRAPSKRRRWGVQTALQGLKIAAEERGGCLSLSFQNVAWRIHTYCESCP